MFKNQSTRSSEINAPVNSSKLADEPQSAHATPIVEKYNKKRKDKAEQQTQEEKNTDSALKQSSAAWDEWNNLKYAIL